MILIWRNNCFLIRVVVGCVGLGESVLTFLLACRIDSKSPSEESLGIHLVEGFELTTILVSRADADFVAWVETKEETRGYYSFPLDPDDFEKKIEAISESDLSGSEKAAIELETRIAAARDFASKFSSKSPYHFSIKPAHDGFGGFSDPPSWPDYPISGNLCTAHSLEAHEQSIELKGGRFNEVSIIGSGSVVVSDCRIRTLIVDGCYDVKISNARIGSFEVLGRNTYLRVRRSTILRFATGRGRSRGPSESSLSEIELFGLRLPTSNIGTNWIGPQCFREMRTLCEKLGNYQAASIFHAAVLALERKNESVPQWFLSSLYKWFSDYGTNPSRPLFWLLYVFVLSVGHVALNNGVIYSGVCAEAIGWQAMLCGNDLTQNVSRAAVLILYQMSVIGVFFSGYEKLPLMANDLSTKMLLSFVSLFSGLQITLFVLAIRRKFRIPL